MIGEQSPTIAVTPKNVIGLSILFLTLAAIFGLLNSHKVKTLRTNAAHAEAARGAQERGGQPQEEKKRKEPAPRRTGVRGTVLAVNQAYNFVVLNLGARQGVEPNSEMLVLREGTLIGRIRISTVEPATAIGDIITSSLARGVQMQPGDTVIYAGTSS